MRKIVAAVAALLLGLVASVSSVVPANAAPNFGLKNSSSSDTWIRAYNIYTGQQWYLSVAERNVVNDYNNGVRIEVSVNGGGSYRYHYDGSWHPWHCTGADANPPNGESEVVIQVEYGTPYC